MISVKRRVQFVVLILLCGIFAFAQDIDIPSITPASPSISVCGDGTFTITVTNDSADPITGITINALVVENAGSHTGSGDFTFTSATPGGYGESPPMVTWEDVTLEGHGSPGGTDTWTGTVTVRPSCEAVIGRALLVSVTYSTGLPPTETTDYAWSGPITVLRPNLAIEVVPLSQRRAVGETAAWDIYVKNVGVGDLTNINLTATLGAGFNPSGVTTGTIPGPIGPQARVLWTHLEADIISCSNLTLTVDGSYGDCGVGGAPCGTDHVEDSITLDYRTPNLSYSFTSDPLNVPYCGDGVVTVQITDNDPAGGTAGTINNLYMGIILPDQLVVYGSPANYTPGPPPPPYGPPDIAGEFSLGTLHRGESTTLTFNVRWKDPCNPSLCDSIIFVPRFKDDCGSDFSPPIQELHIGDPPMVPYFEIRKTGPINLNQGEGGDYDITVTFHAPEGTSITATTIDDVPAAFVASDPSDGGSAIGQVVSWSDRVFTVGAGEDHVTKTYTVTLTPNYASANCGDDFVNRVTITPSGHVCTTCVVQPATATLPLVNTPVLHVEKSGSNTLYVNGAASTYTISVSYSGPLAGGQTPPVRVVDYVPAGVTITNSGGGAYDGTAHTITWVLPAGTLVADGTITLTYDMQLTPVSGYDPCNCGTTFDNRVTAELIVPSIFAGCSDEDTLTIAVQCDNEDQAPFTIQKTVDFTSQDLCGCIAYTNTITFGQNISDWTNVTFTENGNNGQRFSGGSSTGNATFRLNRGGTIYTDTKPITLGSPYGLGGLSGFPHASPPSVPADILAGDVLTVTYTLCLPSGIPPQSFVDWTDIGVAGFVPLCATGNTLFHQGVWVTAVRRPANLTILHFCHWADASNPCSNIINKCEDATFQLYLAQTNPSYNAVVTVDLNGHYSYDTDQTPTYGDGANPLLTGFAGMKPTYSGGVLTWTFSEIPGSGTGYIQFKVHKDCSAETLINASAVGEDLCGITSTPSTAEFEARGTWEGNIIIKKTPQVIYSVDKLPTWVIYVTNRGSGTAYNVAVADTLDTGLPVRPGPPLLDHRGRSVDRDAYQPGQPAPYLAYPRHRAGDHRRDHSDGPGHLLRPAQ